jgi:hypothetical protein
MPVDQVMDDCMKVFHHPAVRENSVEVHRSMFEAVKRWVDSLPDRGRSLHDDLSSESVRLGKNHQAGNGDDGRVHNQLPSLGAMGQPGAGTGGFQSQPGHNNWGGHQSSSSGGGMSSPLAQLSSLPIPGLQNVSSQINKLSSIIPGGLSGGLNRGFDAEGGRSRGLESSNEEMTREDDYESRYFEPPSGYEGYESRSQQESYQPAGDDQNYYGSQYGGRRSDDYYRS